MNRLPRGYEARRHVMSWRSKIIATNQHLSRSPVPLTLDSPLLDPGMRRPWLPRVQKISLTTWSGLSRPGASL
jgi:hypothetical protein